MAPPGSRAIKNARRALDGLGLKYDEVDGKLLLSAMGDDNPIGMLIMADDGNATLNIYCYLMFDLTAESQGRLIPALNRLNNTINNGGFYLDEEGGRIYFKIVQSYFDRTPSVETIAHLVMTAFRTVDVNDGSLKGLVPGGAVRRDLMYS